MAIHLDTSRRCARSHQRCRRIHHPGRQSSREASVRQRIERNLSNDQTSKGEVAMNAIDILKYGHLTVLGSVDTLTDEEWNTPGACGVWSIKNIIAHLASYEIAICEILGSFIDGS